MKFIRSYKSERTLFVRNGEWFVNTRMCELVTHPYSKSARPNRVFQSKNKRFGGDRYYVYSEPVWIAADKLVIAARRLSYAHFQNIKRQQSLWLIGFVARTVSNKYTNGAVIRYTSLLRKTAAPQLLAIAARRRHTVCVELSARERTAVREWTVKKAHKTSVQSLESHSKGSVVKIVYVAGPYSAQYQHEREDNIQVAKRAGLLVALAGGCPLIPHANTGSFWGTKTPEFWYEATSLLLSRCDCALFVDRWWLSKGSVREMVQCLQEGIPCMVLPPASPESGFVAEDTVVELLQTKPQLRKTRKDAIDTTLNAVHACTGEWALVEAWLRDWL